MSIPLSRFLGSKTDSTSVPAVSSWWSWWIQKWAVALLLLNIFFKDLVDIHEICLFAFTQWRKGILFFMIFKKMAWNQPDSWIGSRSDIVCEISLVWFYPIGVSQWVCFIGQYNEWCLDLAANLTLSELPWFENLHPRTTTRRLKQMPRVTLLYCATHVLKVLFYISCSSLFIFADSLSLFVSLFLSQVCCV